MAQYVEKVYAADSWQENRADGQLLGVVRGTTVKTSVEHRFSYDGYPWGITAAQASHLGMEFPLSVRYGKKKLTAASVSAYVTDASVTASGSFQSGRMIFGVDDFATDRFQSDALGAQLEVGTLHEGAYNVLIDWADNIGGNLSKAAANGTLVATPNVWAGCTGDMIVGSSYRAKAAVEIQSHTGSNRPYVEYTYADVIPAVKNCTPRSGFINEKKDARFGWSFSYNDLAVAEKLVQAAYCFRWRAAGESAWNEVTVQSEICSHTVVAGSFPEKGSIQWCVRVQSNDGIWSEWSNVMELTTVDSVPAQPQKLSPDKVYVEGNGAVAFSWQHVIETGTEQQAFEALYSIDEGRTWQMLAAQESLENGFLAAEGALPSGEVLWKVRTANSDGVFGGWSEIASIIVRAKPAAPVIGEVVAAPLATIRWQAALQQGYEVKLGGENSGQRYGTEKNWQCPNLLPDGEHLLQLRVCNRYGLWSDWAESTVQIQNRPVGHIALQSRVVGYEAALSWQAEGDFLRYLVERDGVIIGETEETVFVDAEICGKCRYRIIGLQDDGHYTVSVPLTEQIAIQKAAVGKDGVWIPADLGVDAPPQHRQTETARISYLHRWGEALPAAQKGDGVDLIHELTFGLQDRAHLSVLRSWLGQQVICKDRDSCFTGILESIDLQEKEASKITLTVVQAKEWSDE
ncbi:MAG: hypothetical protein IJE98_05345 [Oscillospiraceae bacterium]|nr:hypothetical protein [Oscillospiraceae bacterium]